MQRVRAYAALGGLALGCTVYDASLLPGAGGGDQGMSGLGAQGGLAGMGSTSSAGGAGAGAASAGTNAVSGGTLSHGGAAPDASGAGGGGDGAVAGAGGEPNVPWPTGSGSISYRRWNGIQGWSVGLVPLDETPPDEQTELHVFRAPGGGESYGARVLGFVTAPIDGAYRFWIACDNNCELWLSTDEQASNLVRIAYVAGMERWSDVDVWDRFASQESVAIELEAGNRYRVEARLKQETGGSHLSVAWLLPGQAGTQAPQVIPGTQLSPP